MMRVWRGSERAWKMRLGGLNESGWWSWRCRSLMMANLVYVIVMSISPGAADNGVGANGALASVS